MLHGIHGRDPELREMGLQPILDAAVGPALFESVKTAVHATASGATTCHCCMSRKCLLECSRSAKKRKSVLMRVRNERFGIDSCTIQRLRSSTSPACITQCTGSNPSVGAPFSQN